MRYEEGGRVKFRCFFDAKAERVHDICVCWKTEKCVFEAVKTMRGSFWESVVGSVGQRSQNKEQVCLFWVFLFLINIRTNSRNTSRRSVACRKSNRRVFYRSQTAEDGPTLSSSSANVHVWTFSTPSPHTPIAGIRLIGSGFGTELCSQQAPQSELLPRADPPLTVEHLLPVRLILDVFAPVAHIAQLLVLQEQKNTGQEMTLEEHSQTRVIILVGLRQPLAATSWQ